MQIIAKTQDGYLVQATGNELKEILTSVSGSRPEEIKVGQKIPAIDYATTITKVKTLKDDYDFKNLFQHLERFYTNAQKLKEVVIKANDIEV